MPLFLIKIKIMNITLIITIIIILAILALYFAVAMAYATKIDNILYYEYPTMATEEINRIYFYVLFWFIFFNKLEKIIQNKK